MNSSSFKLASIFQKLNLGIQEYKILLKFYAFYIFTGAVFRIILNITLVGSFDIETLYLVLYGVRMDTIVFSAIGIVFTLFYTFNQVFLSKLLLTLSVSTYLLIEISTILYMKNFFIRPDYLFIEHLKNYNEVLNMVLDLYKLESVVLLLFIFISAFFFYRFFSKVLIKGNITHKLLVLPLVLIVLFLGLRSSLDMSTPNKSFYTFSSENIKNEIANNSVFSILYTSYLVKKEKFYNYGDISYEDALENVKKMSSIENNTTSLVRYQKSTFTKKKNVILVILESFGHENIGHLGGTPTTPNLDALTRESLYFTDMYATGTRTSWGVSSILTGLYPLPSREYVKASRSQKDFYTIAKTFKEQNYTNTFLYSGDANFDNMRGFLLSNGFDNVYGKEDFSSELTKYTWGYCDEDLYDKAFSLIEKQGDKPYFLTLLTMSSHEPFDYPKDKVKPYEKEKLEGFANSIKYADYAIGKFIDELKSKGMLENTIVAFIADHNPKAYSSFDIPIDKYKIISMIVSDDFNGGQKYEKIASQIDFGPTILDVAGISAEIPTMGSSVLQVQRDSALILAKKRNYAYLKNKRFTVLKSKKRVQTYDYELNKLPLEDKEVEDALSYIYSSKFLYKEKLYN